MRRVAVAQSCRRCKTCGCGLVATRGACTPFRSPRSAQFWSEWREKGYVGPVIFAGYFACVLIWYLAGWSDERGFVLATFTAGYWLVLLFAIMGLSFGKCGGTVRNPASGSFFATRPMSDTALAFSMLKGAAASIAATGLCWVVCMLVVAAVMYGIGAGEHVKIYSEQSAPKCGSGFLESARCVDRVGRAGLSGDVDGRRLCGALW